uniref:Uncharacterized protein n=1 Tax=viral metagenome TaxID=1070528 RepID=A0A6C0I1G0_9ZZZZ
MEIIDLGLSDLDSVSFNIDDSSNMNSGSLGPGIELLMNDKKKSATGSMNIDLGDLDKLENDLNNLSSSSEASNTKSLSGFGNMFGFGSSTEQKKEIHLEPTDSNIGSATADSMGNTKTWDGFTKMNDIPQNAPAARLTDREKRRKKRAMIKKIEEWYDKGIIKNNSHYNMDSPYEEVEDEYETALEDKRKKDSIKIQGWWFITLVNSIEYANSAFNPFDLNLDGWGEQVGEDMDSYEEIFSELHEKYKGGKLSPELSLLLRLGFSAAVVNFTNKALSSATPGFNDVIKQSPELMKMFTNATVSSMSQQSPGFAFASSMMKDGGAGVPMNMGPPPAPVETKSMPPSGQRPGNNNMNFTTTPSNRPDISMGRGAAYNNAPMEQGYESMNRSQQIPSQFNPPPPQTRPEMRGPQNTDIDNILSGLKPKTVDIHINPVKTSDVLSDMGDDSMISIASLTDMQNSNMPKKSRRRNNGSNKNTISLDI